MTPLDRRQARRRFGRRTFWHGFPTIELATAFAAEKELDELEICKKCLGQYNTLTRYGRRLDPEALASGQRADDYPRPRLSGTMAKDLEASRAFVSAKHIRTTGDLMRLDAALRVTCRSCGAARTFNAVDAVMTFGNVPLWHTEEQLKCSRCGRKSAKVETLSPA